MGNDSRAHAGHQVLVQRDDSQAFVAATFEDERNLSAPIKSVSWWEHCFTLSPSEWNRFLCPMEIRKNDILISKRSNKGLVRQAFITGGIWVLSLKPSLINLCWLLHANTNYLQISNCVDIFEIWVSVQKSNVSLLAVQERYHKKIIPKTCVCLFCFVFYSTKYCIWLVKNTALYSGYILMHNLWKYNFVCINPLIHTVIQVGLVSNSPRLFHYYCSFYWNDIKSACRKGRNPKQTKYDRVVFK